jgi:hypothetical protein
VQQLAGMTSSSVQVGQAVPRSSAHGSSWKPPWIGHVERDPAPGISMRDTYMLEYGVVQSRGGPDGGVGQVGDCQSGVQS